MGADYVFATARIRSEEKYLLTSEQFRTMTETKNVEDVCKILKDAGYGNEVEVIRPDNYEKILKKTETDLFEEIKSLSSEEEVFKVFSFQADYHNIKVLLKAEFLNIDRKDILMSTGTIPPEKMAVLIKERDKTMMTRFMGQAVDEAIDNHARTKDPQAIDFICDKYCFQDILRVAEESGNKFVAGYIRLWVDTLNMKTFFRVKKMNQKWGYFGELFIPGGNVDLRILVEGYDDEIAQFAARFEAYDIFEAVSAGGEELERNGTFTTLEKLLDDVLINYVKEAKYITFGLETLVAFLVLKQMEIKCIRILMTGRLAGMDPQVIRERLRETYE